MQKKIDKTLRKLQGAAVLLCLTVFLPPAASGETPIAKSLIITIGDIQITVPRSDGWTLQPPVNAERIAFDNFNHAYGHGGIRPDGGAEMIVFTGPLGAASGASWIEKNKEETDTIASESNIIVGGEAGVKSGYSTLVVEGGVGEGADKKDVQQEVSVPHRDKLYHFILEYYDGDPKGLSYEKLFNDIVASAKFTDHSTLTTDH